MSTLRHFELPIIPDSCPASLRSFLVELGQRINAAIQDIPTITAPDSMSMALSASVSNEWNGVRFDNTGATSPIALTLPLAQVGLEFEFKVIENQPIYVQPDGTDRHLMGTAGQLLVLANKDDSVRIGCYSRGVWEITYSHGSAALYSGILLHPDGSPVQHPDGSYILTD